MVSRGGVAPFDGDLDDYQRYLLDEAKRQREVIKEASSSAAKAERKALAAAPPPTKPKAAPTGSLKRKLEDVEARMAVLNGEGAALEAHLCKSPPPAEIADLAKRLKTVNDELQSLEDQWLSVSGQLEAQPV
jgi:ATP-binding cassette subfamily F protein 3